MTQEAGDEVEVPASLKALLAARLDQLDPAERRVLECGSVEGEVFHRGAVQALTPEETQVTPRLAALVRRELIRSDRPQFAGEDGFRFRHLLIRDTAYDALPKATRAELHQRFAAWLEQHGRAGRAGRDRRLPPRTSRPLPGRARTARSSACSREAMERLAAAGRAALWRDDPRSAESLLERAVALSDRPDVHLVVDLAHSRRDLRAAAKELDEAAERAEVDGDAAGVALARALAATVRGETFEVSVDEQERLALAALPLLEAAGDHAGLAEVWESLAYGVLQRTLPLRPDGARSGAAAPARRARGPAADLTRTCSQSLSCTAAAPPPRHCNGWTRSPSATHTPRTTCSAPSSSR